MKTTLQEPEENKDVHTEHCCVLHHCKYGDDDCPVVTGKKHQSFLCEDCECDGITDTDMLKKVVAGTQKICPHCGHVL
jgi:hypothetical protein